jgi:hypothetical protein
MLAGIFDSELADSNSTVVDWCFHKRSPYQHFLTCINPPILQRGRQGQLPGGVFSSFPPLAPAKRFCAFCPPFAVLPRPSFAVALLRRMERTGACLWLLNRRPHTAKRPSFNRREENSLIDPGALCDLCDHMIGFFFSLPTFASVKIPVRFAKLSVEDQRKFVLHARVVKATTNNHLDGAFNGEL